MIKESAKEISDSIKEANKMNEIDEYIMTEGKSPDVQALQEFDISSTDSNNTMSTLVQKFISHLRSFDSSRDKFLKIIPQIEEHTITATAAEIYLDDAMQIDETRNKVFWIDSEDEALVEELEEVMEKTNINEFLTEVGDNALFIGESYIRVYNTKDDGFFSYEIINDYDKYNHIFYKGIPYGYIYTGKNKVQYIPEEEIIHIYNPGKVRYNKPIKVDVGNGKKEEFRLKYGSPIFKSALSSFLIVKSIEDAILAARLGRTDNFRIVEVEVGNAETNKAKSLVKGVRNKFELNRTFSRDKGLETMYSPIRTGDFVFLPVREGKGAVNVNSVGGEYNVKEAFDLEYHKNILFGGLKIPKSFMGFEEALPGGMNNTSLTKLDIRYARSVKRVKRMMLKAVKSILDFYIKHEMKDESKLNAYKIGSVKISTAEALDRIDELSTRTQSMDTINRFMTDMKTSYDIEIDEEEYAKDLIRRVFDEVPSWIKGKKKRR